MPVPKISVIIPVFNQEHFISDAIQSVLDQTYRDFELIVVNDGSTDQSANIINSFNDPRIRIISHEINRGLAAARNTGIRAARGELIAFLDSDDLFRPQKLKAHIVFLDENPCIGATYNSRFNLNHSSDTVRDIWRPPSNVTLLDFVLGYPFSPSDLVLRKEWALRIGLLDEQYVYFGEDRDFNCRLALAGCTFAHVDRVLNLRRYHSGRIYRNIPAQVNIILQILERIFANDRCPEEVIVNKHIAFSNVFITWGLRALAQDETALGQSYLRKAIQLCPSLIKNHHCSLLKVTLDHCLQDDSMNHEVLLQQIIAQLPEEIEHISNDYSWAIARGYLIKGARALIWDRYDDGRNYMRQAITLKADIDDDFLGWLTVQILNYELEFGDQTGNYIVDLLGSVFDEFGAGSATRRLRGLVNINRGFDNYRSGNYTRVPSQVVRAVINEPKLMFNKGVWSILIRSVVRQYKRAEIPRPPSHEARLMPSKHTNNN